MRNFTGIDDVANISKLIQQAIELKQNPYAYHTLGKHKTIGLVFLNPSLRTRLSTQKAALNLGMNVMVMNMDKEGWALEFGDGAIMNGTTVEHIKDAAAVMGQYCDIIGIRCFPSLTNKEEDDNETLLNKFIQYAKVPVVSLESATRHPLQSFADLITISENWNKPSRPKVVLTWAPHIKALPLAVPNSFSEWMCKADVEFVITHPKGLELNTQFTEGATITHNQQEALIGADFVYVKNWSSYENYGQPYLQGNDWLLTEEKLCISNEAKIMHCLPVRRNVELIDALLDGPNSLVLQQANNRVFAAQTILKTYSNTMDKPTLHLIKIGGNIIDDEQAVAQVLKQICTFNEPFILVHGGGKVATNLCETLLIETNLIDGRRVTDAATLEIVTMVYAGLINKKMVAQLQAQGKNAIGLSGADANIMPAKKRSITPIDYGFVGDLDANTIGVNSLEVLLKNNMIPVVSSITHDSNGQLLNTNADTIAATLAMAMSKIYNTKLYLCFEKKGVLSDANQTDAVLPTLNESTYYTLKENGTINKGMIPKVDNAFAALKQGVSQVFIMHALDLTNTENAAGTQLVIG